MKPFTEQSRELLLRWPHECRVVVLGVLCPSLVPQPREISEDLPQLPASVFTGKRSTDVIFYDPISSRESDEPNLRRFPKAITEKPCKHDDRETSKDSQDARRKAIDAVVGDLARLSMKQRAEK